MTSQTVYSDVEWGLLVGLPQSVVVAVTSAEADGGRRTQAEGLAGIEAIAAGRDSGSALVHDVATEVVAQTGDPERGEAPPPIEFTDRAAGLAGVLDRAREASKLLSAKAAPGEAAAYRHWLMTIAEQVAAAAKSGGFLGIGGDRVSPAERKFLDDLAAVLI